MIKSIFKINSMLTKLFAVTVYLYMLPGFTVYMMWFDIHGIEEHLPDSISSVWKFYAPHSFYANATTDFAEAFTNNMFLMMLFGALHSILATSPGIAVFGLPDSINRPLFVLQSTVCLHLQMVYW